MDKQWTASTWVASHQDGIDFALQVVTVDTREDPQGHLLAANVDNLSRGRVILGIGAGIR